LVLARAGCFPRDVVTTRTVEEVKSGSGSWGRHEPNDLLEGLTPGKPSLDSDNDGMPDEWEIVHGHDRRKDDSAQLVSSGYTAIEEYVNAVAAKLLAAPRQSPAARR